MWYPGEECVSEMGVSIQRNGNKDGWLDVECKSSVNH